MKNQLSLFVATLATLFITITASAQGEWKWAHYWSGGDGSYGDYYNQITNTAFDEDGNIYVYGTMGGSPQFDGLTFQFVNNGAVLNKNDRSILLAKFDTLGNMLWYKVVKSSSEMAFPLWMEVRNNKVYISGNCGFYGDYSDDWLYYLDTLVYKYQLNNIPEEQQELPFRAYHRWTFFAQFDLEGNLLEDHFVEAYSRDSFFNGTDSIRRNQNLCVNDICPVHIGIDGSVYVYTQIQYQGNESQPYTIVVDGDSNKTYNLYLPGNADAPYSINNAFLYKFTSDWELDYAKPLVIETDGIAPYGEQQTGDHIKYHFYPRFEGMCFDEEDNMYITGHVRLGQSLPGLGGELNTFPVHIWWDSVHNLTIHDISSADLSNFVVKYNTSGNVQWCNQIRSRCGDDVYLRPIAQWGGCAVLGNSICILGGGGYSVPNNSLLYFDDESDSLQYYQQGFDHIGFFVRYNKFDGTYLNQGIVPSEIANTKLIPCCINNRILGFAMYNLSGTGCLLTQWRDDGMFIGADTINGSLRKAGVIVNENGYLVASLMTTEPVVFDNNVSVNCSGLSNAVLALYHNPEFTQPFVPDDSVGIDEYYQNREREIYLYPNPTDGRTTVCGYMYGYRSIELLDLQGRRLATLLDSPHGTDVPEIDLSPYPSGTYLVKINFERGVSVVRKVVRM